MTMTGLEAKFIRREHDAGETLENIVGNIEETSAVGQLTVGTINTPPVLYSKTPANGLFCQKCQLCQQLQNASFIGTGANKMTTA